MEKAKHPYRCAWCGEHPLYTAYHDEEWGVPVRDDKLLFEFLILEGAQAGLRWLTILKKRPAYRRAYEGFDPKRIAGYGEGEKRRLLADAGIVRNRLKIEASIGNARAVMALYEQGRSLTDYLWAFTDGRTITNRRRSLAELPATSPASDAMSRALKQRGFRFVGSTICYALMQAVGMVNDHETRCFRHAEIRRLSKA